MAQDKVSRKGRIRYVEPNDFIGNSHNIIHPYEDYSIYVDLVVCIILFSKIYEYSIFELKVYSI